MYVVDGCNAGIVNVHLEAGVYDVVVWPFFVAEGGVWSVCGRGVLGCNVMVEWVGGRRGMTIAIVSWSRWIGFVGGRTRGSEGSQFWFGTYSNVES